MTGPAADQVAELVQAVSVLPDGVWPPIPGRRRVPGVYRAVVLTPYLLRRNESPAVAGEPFGCSRSGVSRMTRRPRALLRPATAEPAGQLRVPATRSAVPAAGLLAPTGERSDVVGMYCGKRQDSGLNGRAVADPAGRLVDTGLATPGGRHAGTALTGSGIADRWAAHLHPGGPGMLADLGYRGTGAITGERKPPGGERADVQRTCNRAINSVRAAVERAIAHRTNWKILDTGWRGRLTEFPELLRTVTGLEIYRVWG
jgi:DDE superfamily endonuclease